MNRQSLISAFALLLVLLAGNSALLAQDEEAQPLPADSPETSTPQIIYIDVPQVLVEGEDPVYPTPVPAEDPQDPANLQRERTMAEYGTAVTAIEAQGGVWDPLLVEQLSALGELQQLQGDHETAVATYDRAMHNNRINNGLHTTDQVPIVEELIDSYLAMEDWDNADLYHDYLFFIQQKAYGGSDPRMIPVLEKLAQWNLQAFYMGYGETLGVRLSTAQLLYNAAVRMVGLHFGRQDERFVPYLRSIADSAFLVAQNPELLEELNRPDYRTNQDILASKINARTSIVPTGFRTGEGALKEVITVFEEQDDEPYLLAEAYANLGDWYLLFEQRRNAQEQYTLAWELLATLEDGAALQQQLFGQVTPIPTSEREPRLVWRRGSERFTPAELEEGFVDLSFTVTRTGEVRRVESLAKRLRSEPVS